MQKELATHSFTPYIGLNFAMDKGNKLPPAGDEPIPDGTMVKVTPDTSNVPEVAVALQMNAMIGQCSLVLMGEICNSTLQIAGQWKAEKNKGINLVDWIKDIIPDDTLPPLLDTPVTVNEFTLSYKEKESREIEAALHIDPLAKMQAKVYPEEGKYHFSFIPEDLSVSFSGLPLVGQLMHDNDALKLDGFYFDIERSNIIFSAELTLALGDTKKNIPITFTKARQPQQDRVINAVADDVVMSNAVKQNENEVAIAPAGNMPAVMWADITKRFGIFTLNRIGVGMEDAGISLYLDAGFTLGPLALDFYELKVAIPLHNFRDFHIALSGLAVSMQKPPLILSGGLYRDKNVNGMMYTGELIVGCAQFRLTALASYGVNERNIHSMFVYAVLHANIGGPPFMFITGLAAGLGINRSLTLPAKVEEVKDFPFVAIATETAPVSGMLSKLNSIIRIDDGNYFACAGLRFTSFGLLDSFLLLNIEFGNRFRFSALGLSTLAIPPKQHEDKCIARAVLTIKAEFSPDEGILAIMGVLSNDSFVLDKKCKLTGGFAVYAWNKGEHAGDFVVTFGGYHPAFIKPAHYPTVPPLGITWNITDNLSLRGNIYFALTPSAVMAGGQLALNYQSGNLKAWLTAYAHFLMQWKPFFYDIRLGVSVGASYTVNFLFFRGTLRIELGADIHIWGPEFRGTARINWFIISFTISFGNQSPVNMPALTWADFKETFLPGGANGIVSIQISEGLVSPVSPAENHEKAEAPSCYLIKPNDAVLSISSQLALTGIMINEKPISVNTAPAIRSMKLSSYKACLKITIEGVSHKQWCVMPIKENAPAALWGQPLNGSLPTLNANSTVSVVKGCVVTPSHTTAFGHIPCINGAEKSYSLAVLTQNEEIHCHSWKWSSSSFPDNKYQTLAPVEDPGVAEVLETITNKAVSTRRMRIVNSLFPGFSVSVKENTGLLFANPLICTTGSRPGKEKNNG
ncbi:DUF6603 domain-containing protein [Klebsiella quasivariicola]|uniref:DUF6603 domain-containing protein n=1 Tax=Klebsiella quasivariicola TaxID=2026240 RepID=UPI00247A9F3B|nr:DUF6603 domain-containing protein [Klebsiella quasivariicola]